MVGYATVVTSTAFYDYVTTNFLGNGLNPYVLVAVGTAIMALVNADCAAGVSSSTKMFASRAISMGANPAICARLTTACAVSLDSLPHCASLNVCMNFLGLSHKEAYKDIAIVQLGCTSIAAIFATVLATIIG